MTTLLIFFPIAVALLLWLVPFPGRTAASLALLAALVEVAIWILALQRFEFDKAGLQFSDQTDWSTDLGFSYHVGMYGFLSTPRIVKKFAVAFRPPLGSCVGLAGASAGLASGASAS